MNAKFETILDTVGQHANRANQENSRRRRRQPVRQDGDLQSVGSVKDRLALGIIEDAERSGELKPGQTVVEATSGNTGIGLAMVCAAKRLSAGADDGRDFSVERRKLMRFLGAKVVLTPAAQRGMGMVAKASGARQRPTAGFWPPIRERVQSRHAFADHAPGKSSRTSPASLWILGHRDSAPAEPSRAWRGCCAKERPKNASHRVASPRTHRRLLGSGTRSAAKPRRFDCGGPSDVQPHPMQGWTPDFIPKLAVDAVEPESIISILRYPAPRLRQCREELASRGRDLRRHFTSGATFAGALKVCKEAPKGPSCCACCRTPANDT